MKKLCFVCLLLLFPALAACGGSYDYGQHLSEVKSDLFCGETDQFSVTLSCISREYPYANDGIACPRTQTAEISLRPKDGASASYSVYVQGETAWGGETSYRNIQGDYYYSQGVTAFPERSVTLRVEWEGGAATIEATSVKTEKTLPPDEALARAVEAEKDAIGRMTENGVFCGEFRVRLLKREAVYYYVGIVGKNGENIALLLDSESGEILARRAL